MSEPQEPTDEEVIEALGGEQQPPADSPQGRYTCALSQQPPADHANAQSDGGNEEGGQDKGDKVLSPSTLSANGSARDDEIRTLADTVMTLPAVWMRVYVIALYEHGDAAAARAEVTRRIGHLKPSIVERAMRDHPEFAEMVKDHAKVQDERVFSAIYRGATEGDQIPLVSQGHIIGHYPRRSDRAGEIWLKARGLMADQKSHLHITHSGKVEMSHDEQLGEIMDQVAQGLFLGGPVIDAEVVKDSEDGVSK